MPIRIRWIEWSNESRDHIALHGVTTEEVEDVAFGEHHARRGREGRYQLIGQSAGGRYITVFIVPTRIAREEYYVVTAREATERERRQFR
jgi:uncharacterized DUF497 family protein